ncbi:MAG UNVERIFIED_CONTAM: hypothetical protein LVT10_14785 [Anaerolineae bacterium]|jgi:hypothetical protein
MKPLRLIWVVILLGLLGQTSLAVDDELARVESILQEMTPAQKVGQLFMVGLYGTEMTEDARELITRYRPGLSCAV